MTADTFTHAARTEAERVRRDAKYLTPAGHGPLLASATTRLGASMTTLYRPVLIETAEQAEALPEGAVLLGGHFDEPWDLTTFYRDPDEGCPAAMLDALAAGVRVTALVPVEAEEEHGGWGFCTPGCERILHSHYPRTRLVTQWEEA